MLVNPNGLQFQYVGSEKLVEQTANQPFAQILFDRQCINSAAQLYVSTGLRSLLVEHASECVLTAAPYKRGYTQNSYWAETEHYLLLAYWVDEADLGGLARATEAVYSQLLIEIQERGYPHLVRVWNYFADINSSEQNLERYRHFCVGRFNAFARRGMHEEQFPSACALGHGGGDLLVYALASKVAPQHFENPQQASAYHYPVEYGPRSPSFARASLLEVAHQTATLFVSGTASVMGHVTQYSDNLSLQIQVTLNNLECLLEHVRKEYAKQHNAILPTLTAEVLKVYVRHEQDLREIQQSINQAYPLVPVVYLAAEICRADLLLEVDGIWNLART